MMIEITRRGRKSNKIQEKRMMLNPISQHTLTSPQPILPASPPSLHTGHVACGSGISLLASLCQCKACQSSFHESKAVASLINPVGSAEETSWEALTGPWSPPTPQPKSKKPLDFRAAAGGCCALEWLWGPGAYKYTLAVYSISEHFDLLRK